MKSRCRLLKSLALLGLCLMGLPTNCLVHAEGKQIPDGSRTWTHQDGRTAELCYLKSVDEAIVLTDVNKQRVFQIAVSSLSDADQLYVRSLSNDGTRIWTQLDETSRRMRLIAVEGEKVVFEVPNAGRRSTLVSSLIPADRALVTQLVSNGPPSSRTSRFIMRSKDSPIVVPVANQLSNQQVVEAVDKAFESDELKQALNVIGSDAKFSAGETEDAINVAFGQLKLPSDEAVRQLAALTQKAKSQVTQILGLREADATLFGLSFNLVPQSGTGIGSAKVSGSGSGHVGETLNPSLPVPIYHGEACEPCFSGCGVSLAQCDRISCCTSCASPLSISSNCSSSCDNAHHVDSSCPNWQPAECQTNRCRLGFARLRRGISE